MSQVAVVKKEEFQSHFSNHDETQSSLSLLSLELHSHLKNISFLSDFSLPSNIFPSYLSSWNNNSSPSDPDNSDDYGIQYNFLLDNDQPITTTNDDYYNQSSSLFSLEWNTKFVDHTDNFYSLLQFYYGPLKLIMFLLFLMVLNTIGMISLVKYSWIGDFMENTVFNSITNRALNEMSLRGDLSQMTTLNFFIGFLKNSAAMSSVFYIMTFFIVFTIVLLGVSFIEFYWILKWIQKETGRKLKFITKKLLNDEDHNQKEDTTISASAANSFTSEYLIIDKSWKDSTTKQEELIIKNLSKIIYGHVKYLEYEILQDGSEEKLAISKFILEKLIFNNGSKKRNLLNAARIIEISDFSLKKCIKINDEYLESNFHVALQFFEVTIKDVLKESNASAIVFKVNSLQYGLIRLCDKMGFTLVLSQKSDQFPIINYYYVLESNKL